MFELAYLIALGLLLTAGADRGSSLGGLFLVDRTRTIGAGGGVGLERDSASTVPVGSAPEGAPRYSASRRHDDGRASTTGAGGEIGTQAV